MHIKVRRSLPIASQLKHLLSFCRRKRLNGATTRVVWRKWCWETEKKNKLKSCRCSEKGQEDFIFLTATFFWPLYSYLLLFLTTTVFWTIVHYKNGLLAVISVWKTESVIWKYTKLCGWIHTQILFWLRSHWFSDFPCSHHTFPKSWFWDDLMNNQIRYRVLRSHHSLTSLVFQGLLWMLCCRSQILHCKPICSI